MTNRVIAGLVRDGLFHHRSGNLERAGRLYGQILESHPNHPGVLHLLGVLLYQRGDLARAGEAIARAIALRPNEAHFHANLAHIFRAMGLTSLAKGSRTLALRLRPDLYETPMDFDLLLVADPSEVEELPPDDPPPPVVPEAAIEQDRIANEFQRRGDRAAAIRHESLAVSLAPEVGALRCNLGQFLLEEGRTQEALAQCAEGVRLSPFVSEAQNNLGNVLRTLRRFEEARGRYLNALRLSPDLPYLYRNLSLVLREESREDEAVTWLRLALSLDPNSVATRWNLAAALKELGELDEARSLCESALGLDPASFEARTTLGSVCHEFRRNDEAARHFRGAVEWNPAHVPALFNLGLVHVENGDFEAGESWFREAIRVDENLSRAHFELAAILRGKLPEADLARIERLLSDPNQDDDGLANLHFAAALVLDARRDFEGAGEHLRLANAKKLAEATRIGREYRAEEHDDFIDQVTAAFSAEFFDRVKAWGSSTERPIFVFGLPRSGTTLTEQILASHSQVHGAGESSLARRTFEKLVSGIDPSKSPAECLDFLDEGLVARLAGEYLAGLDEIDGDARFVVDKLPENYFYLGLLATLFPRGRFIHCRRDLKDIAVSCWSTNFRNVMWANDFDHIASRFAGYRRFMRHWSKTLPVPILDVDYEATVADLEGEARRLVAWCDIEWEPACLAFHEARNLVQTASMTQVRQPIYRRSVARWRNYEALLGPLFDRLAQIDAGSTSYRGPISPEVRSRPRSSAADRPRSS